jgi:hypothetical protein
LLAIVLGDAFHFEALRVLVQAESSCECWKAITIVYYAVATSGSSLFSSDNNDKASIVPFIDFPTKIIRRQVFEWSMIVTAGRALSWGWWWCPIAPWWWPRPPTHEATALRSIIVGFIVPGALTGMFPWSLSNL